MSQDKEYAGLPEPNHTQTPNAFYDELLKRIDTLTELKVTLAIIRQTFGWHRSEDELSLSRLQELTGLTRQGVCDGVEAGLKRGSILRRRKGQSFIYRVKLVNAVDQQLVNAVDQSIPLTSQRCRPELVNAVDQQLVNAVDPQKKEEKEKKERGSEPRKKRAPGLATPAPEDFPLTTDLVAWAITKAPAVNLEHETEKFLAHYRATGKRWKDWRHAWRSWMLKAVEFGSVRAGPPPPSSPPESAAERNARSERLYRERSAERAREQHR